MQGIIGFFLFGQKTSYRLRSCISHLCLFFALVVLYFLVVISLYGKDIALIRSELSVLLFVCLLSLRDKDKTICLRLLGSSLVGTLFYNLLFYLGCINHVRCILNTLYQQSLLITPFSRCPKTTLCLILHLQVHRPFVYLASLFGKQIILFMNILLQVLGCQFVYYIRLVRQSLLNQNLYQIPVPCHGIA